MKRLFSLITALFIICLNFYNVFAQGYSYVKDGNYVCLTAENDYFGSVAVGLYNKDGVLIDAKIFYDEIFYKNIERRFDIDDLKADGASYIKAFLLDGTDNLKPGEINAIFEDDYNYYSVENGKFSGCFKEESDISEKAKFKILDASLNEISSGIFYAENGFYNVSLDAAKNIDESHGIIYICDENDNIKRKYSLDYKKAPTYSGTKKMIADISNKTRILKALISKCNEAGITTDYETVDFRVCERFCIYMADDKNNGDFRRIDYTYDECLKLFADAAEKLNHYLSGTEMPFKVPKYVTSKTENNGIALTAETETDGTRERRPVYFVGYGHFTRARADIPLFNDFGANTIQQETGPSRIIKSPLVWEEEKVGTNSEYYTGKVVQNTVKSGKQAYEIRYKGDLSGGDKHATIYQQIKLEPNKTYEYGFNSYIINTADTASSVRIWYSLDNYEEKQYIPSETSGWSEHKQTYKTSSDAEEHIFRITITGDIAKFCIDDAFILETESGKNLLKNPGFENDIAAEYYIDEDEINSCKDMLESAENNNVAVNFLLSPHYFPEFIYEKYPDVKDEKNGGFIYSHPKAREVIEEYLRTILPEIKDYNSLQSLCLMNEPGVSAAECDYYKTEWEVYLENLYGDIASLNSAYQSSYQNFDEVPMHNTDDSTAAYRDYWKFNNGILTDFHKFMADIIREYMPDIPLHTKFMWYVGSSEASGEYRSRWSVGASHEELSDILDYNGCDAAYYWELCKYDWTKPLNQSLWYDYLRGVKEAPVVNSEAHIIRDRDQNFEPVQCTFTNAGIWQGMIHGNAVSNIWVWDRSRSDSSTLWGSVLFRPDLISAIGKTSLDLNRLSYEVKAVAEEKAKVAVLYSDTARIYDYKFTENLYDAYETLLYGGHKAYIVTEKNLNKIVFDENITVLVLPGIYNLSKSTVNEIKAFESAGGKVIVLGENSLLKNELNQNFSGEDSSLINEIKEIAEVISLPLNQSGKKKLISSVEGICGAFVKLTDENGNEISDTEYTYGFCDGDLIINICNYDMNSTAGINVKIMVGGNETGKFTELRKNESYKEGMINIKPFSPVIIKVGKADFSAEKTGKLIIAAEGETEKMCTVTIKDLNGNVVFISQNNEPQDGFYIIPYTIGDFQIGSLYTVNIGGANGYIYSKELN